MRRFVCVVLLVCLLLSAAPAALGEAEFLWTLAISAEGSITAETMCLIPEGGVYVAGSVEGEADCGAPLGGQDAYIALVDTAGEIVWQHRLGGTGNECFTHVIEALGGGCLAMGVTNSADGHCRAGRGMKDAFLARIDENGELLWTKCLGGTRDDELLAISLWEEGGYLVCGRSRSYNGDLGANFGGTDAWAMLLSEADGKPQWVVRYGEDGNDSFSMILPAYDHWIFVGTLGAALTEVPPEETEDDETAENTSSLPVALAIDGTGEILWEHTLGGEGVSILSAANETENGWLLAGSTNSTSALMPAGRGGMDLWALMMRQNGMVSWQRTYGGELDETFHSLYAADAGGYLYLASTKSQGGHVYGSHGAEDLWVVKVSQTGQLEWQQALGGSGWSEPVGLVSDGTGGYFAAGSTVSQDGDIGAHRSMRTGFLAHLAANGNLLSLDLIGGNEEFSAVSLQRNEEGVYLLGLIRKAEPTGVRDEVWLGKLLESY